METTTPAADRPTMRHRLRISAACFCFVLCIGFVALWVLSFYTFTHVGIGETDWTFYGLEAANVEGRLLFGWPIELFVAVSNLQRYEIESYTRSKKGMDRTTRLMVGRSRYFPYLATHQGFYLFSSPHWSLVLLTTTLAILLKPKLRLKFSLRELLLLTTIAAVVLGAVAALGRVAS